MTLEVTLVSVNVALPSVMAARHRGQVVRSGIDKRPVDAAFLALGIANLDGDAQADLSVHGGPDKAVYAYAADHFPDWEAEFGRPFGPGSFGENLTTLGAREAEVCVGDRWAWGDAVLEVCQPRTPCYKLTLHSGTAEVGRRLRATGRSGWYLRVLQPGTVPTSGTITVARHPAAVSILDLTEAWRRRDRDGAARALRVSALADEWREPLSSLLADP